VSVPTPLVDLSVDIDASPETVWRILSTPDGFSAWMDGEVEFEPRAGSPFKAAFPQFQTVIVGEVVTMDADARHLEVTWGVSTGPQADDFPAERSLVGFRVLDRDGGCVVHLTHSRLPSDDLAAQHEAGWRFHLGRMQLRANRSDLAPGLERTLPDWFAAWNDPDPESRLRALERCCAPDVEFSDEWALASGIELLSTHIGNCHHYMPGWRIEPTGDVRICRGRALVGWRSNGPDGEVEGHNHVTADHDGTIRRVEGFPAA